MVKVACHLFSQYFLPFLILAPFSNSDCLEIDNFNSKYRQLLQQAPIGLIHSTYYGGLGVEDGSLKASHSLSRDCEILLPRDGPSPHEPLSFHTMKMTR